MDIDHKRCADLFWQMNLKNTSCENLFLMAIVPCDISVYIGHILVNCEDSDNCCHFTESTLILQL